MLSIDDDTYRLYWLMTRMVHGRIKDTIQLLAIATQHACCCVDDGIGVFGCNVSVSPMARHAHAPFQLRGWVNGCYFGVADRDLRIHKDVINSNHIDLSLRSMAASGMIWIDQRFHPIHGGAATGKSNGGIADLRSSQVYDHALRVLEELWPGVFEPLWVEKMESGLTRHKLHLPR